ncbi:HET-domain-containing protein [Camillea tinctor]|nr:HET-domain-containing protein [Camillea tinctor]
MADVSDSERPLLCGFCSSIDWEEILTKPFNPQKEKLDIGFLKHSEYNLGVIRVNSETCELCRLIGSLSKKELKAWYPIADKLDNPELITCAFFSRRNRLGSEVQTRRIAEADALMDSLLASTKPGYSSTGLVLQEFLDSLAKQGIRLDPDAKGSKHRNNSLNRLLVMAGISPVSATAQQFLQLHPCLYPLPSVDEYTEGNDPYTNFPTGRIVHPEVNTKLLKRWYEKCIANHGESCSKPSWMGADVGTWPRNLRLIDIQQGCIVDVPPEAQPTYFALSYVWGDNQGLFRATTANLESLKRPGALTAQSLPKTLADALHLTHAMGVSYLWVDRLCVLQDSDPDQAVQIPQMDRVYARAAVTLVAAHGHNAHAGLPGINGTSREDPTPIENLARVAPGLAVMSVLQLDERYLNSTWRTRGWTFQEGLCARRTLIISSEQVFWLCPSARCCESLALEAFPRTVAGPADIPTAVGSGHAVFAEDANGGFAYNGLDALVRAYCARELSVEGDALDAFQGVLAAVGAANAGMRFHWGHAAGVRFDESLAWLNFPMGEQARGEVVPERRVAVHRLRDREDGTVREVRFPSWSWLGWRNVRGVTKAAPRQVRLVPELEIMKVDIYGRAAPLVGKEETVFESVSRIDMRGVDASTSAGWKGDTRIPSELLHSGDRFEDSGRLLFWTSLAVLDSSEGRIYSGRNAEERVKIGELKSFWPWWTPKPEGRFSFIVLSRKHNDNETKVLRAERRLNVMAIEWEDREARVGSRLFVGDVDEEAWVGEERSWMLVTLA